MTGGSNRFRTDVTTANLSIAFFCGVSSKLGGLWVSLLRTLSLANVLAVHRSCLVSYLLVI